MIVQQKHFDGQAVAADGKQFAQVHQQAAIAVNGQNRGAGIGKMGAHRVRQGKPHGAEPTGGNEGFWRFGHQVLGGKHLVIADPGGYFHVLGELGRQQFHHLGLLDCPGLPVEIQRKFLFQLAAVFLPRADMQLDGVFFGIVEQIIQGCFRPTDEGELRLSRKPDFLHLLGIDIEIGNIGFQAEFSHLLGNPVIPTNTEGNEKIRLLNGHVRGRNAKHAEHAEGEVIVFIEDAFAHQAPDRRYLVALVEGSDPLASCRRIQAATDVEKGTLCILQDLEELTALVFAQMSFFVIFIAESLNINGVVHAFTVLNVKGKINDHRAGFTGLGEKIGVLDDFFYVVQFIDQNHLFCRV